MGLHAAKEHRLIEILLSRLGASIYHETRSVYSRNASRLFPQLLSFFVILSHLVVVFRHFTFLSLAFHRFSSPPGLYAPSFFFVSDSQRPIPSS